MDYRFIGVQLENSSDGPSYARTYIYDRLLTEQASFSSGDPVADFASATEFCASSDFGGVYVVSPSVDDLVFDLPGYRFDPDAGAYGAVVEDPRDTPGPSPR